MSFVLIERSRAAGNTHCAFRIRLFYHTHWSQGPQRASSHSLELLIAGCFSSLTPLCASLLSLPARLLPEAEAERRRRAGGKRESGRRAVTQAEGPPADTFSTGDPTLRDQPTFPCSPVPQWHREDSSAWSKACSVHWICPTPPPLTPKSQHCHTHLAFLHCCDIRASFVHVSRRPPCRIFTDLWALVFLASGWSSGAFSGRLRGRIVRAWIDLFLEFKATICPWGEC